MNTSFDCTRALQGAAIKNRSQSRCWGRASAENEPPPAMSSVYERGS